MLTRPLGISMEELEAAIGQPPPPVDNLWMAVRSIRTINLSAMR